MIIRSISALCLFVSCVIYYRFGGSDAPHHSWQCDWVCPAFILAAILILRPATHWYGWLMVIPAYGLIGAGLSTYLDPITALWRKDNVKRWENWLMHGALAASGVAPLVYGGSIRMIGVIAYSVAVGVACSVSSSLISNAEWEEKARGAWFVLCSPLVLL